MTAVRENKRSSFMYGLLFVGVTAGVLLSSIYKQQVLFLSILLGLSFLFSAVAPSYFLLLFFLFTSTNDVFTKEDFLFTVIGIKQILGAVMILFYFHRKARIDAVLKRDPYYHSCWYLLKTVAFAINLITIYWIYTYFKNYYFGMHDFDLNLAVTKSFNLILIFYSIVPFIKCALVYLDRKTMINFLLYSVFFMLAFTFLSPYLPALGLRSPGTVQTEFESNSFQRYTGIIINGDSNTLGVYFVLVTGLLLVINDFITNKPVYVITLALSFIAIALSGSRTAFISLGLVLFLFVFLSKSNFRFKFALMLFIPFVVVVSLPYLSLVLERLTLAGQQFDTKVDTNRIGKWILYWEFFLDNPVTFLTGAQKELRIAWNDTYYTAHNVFITMIYNAGLIFPVGLLLQLTKTFKRMKKAELIKDYVILFIPFLLLIITVSDLGIFCPLMVFSMVFIRLKADGISRQQTYSVLRQTDPVIEPQQHD